jgi:hypothetical protein
MERSGYTMTYPMSPTARYFIRGYFDGSGQHHTAIWDLELGHYLCYYPNKIALFRDDNEAIEFLRLHSYI